MCGITAGVARRQISKILIDALKRLEYRGYDSAGIALLQAGQAKPSELRCVGKVATLENKLKKTNINGNVGIAHTRWATHGKPSEINAHPQFADNGKLAIVHNGIIENHNQLRAKLKKQGCDFKSATDTEVLAHLIATAYSQNNNLATAIRTATKHCSGVYALVAMHSEQPDTIVGYSLGSPLIVGCGIEENYLASDPMALATVTDKFIDLLPQEIAILQRDTVTILNSRGSKVNLKKRVRQISYDPREIGKGEYKHYMLKEIYEQPAVIAKNIAERISAKHLIEQSLGTELLEVLTRVKHVQMVACGTSYNSALLAKNWIEKFAATPVSVEIASEYRCRYPTINDSSIYVTISQSGETADVLAALRVAQRQKYLATVAVCNVANSTLVRAAQYTLQTLAGPEIGVASTKAFTTQLTVLLLLSIALAKSQQKITASNEAKIITKIRRLPKLMHAMLALRPQIETMAQSLSSRHHALFIGRSLGYPLMLEATLKIKELSYIHAEAYASGELKHGPLALVDSEMVIISYIGKDALVAKNLSNLEEVKARGGQIYLFADEKIKIPSRLADHLINLPSADDLVAPIAQIIPFQLLAYATACIRGHDVDQPRNLAKSVTVE